MIYWGLNDAEMVKETMYPKIVVLRVDEDTLNQLDMIADFEHKRRAVLMRDMLIEKIQVYNRRPDYKAYRKRLERRLSAE